jgi:hypothetical protein
MNITHSSATPTVAAKLELSEVNVRIKISGLWTAMLFAFAYVDIFSLYRPDFRAEIEAGRISEFAISQFFLLATTIYIVVPSLMVFATLVMRPGVSRRTNMGLSVVYALTILAGAIGEWNFYLFASAVEVALLALIFYYAKTWPRAN